MSATTRLTGSSLSHGPAMDERAARAGLAVPILMVDDNPAKRLALKAVLEPLGYSIVEADSGLAALRSILVQDFAVILLDVVMPIMDGFETAALIRQRRQSEMTPIIFITAHGKDEIVNTDLYAEGAVDFIFAPVPPDELRAKVSVFANLFTKAEQLAARARGVQASADQLRLLTDAAPIGIFQTDAENRYVYTNPRWSEITGIPNAEAAGREWGTIIGAERRAGLISDLADPEVYRGELCHRIEILVPNSQPRIALVTSKSIPDSDGGAAGWVGTVADITAEAGAEAAMSDARDTANEASRLKSDFLANMSHEIRTPMNGVIGMTDLLLETDLDASQRDYAQTVRNSGEALLTIINDILDFSKVEAGKLDVEEIEFEVRGIVGDVVDLLSEPARSKGLELVAAVESSVPRVIRGDPGRVRQVLTNLIGNAIKFTQAGEISVRVEAPEATGTERIVRFDVSDTGDGIAPDKLKLVFQPFVQADMSTSRKYGGTGLGLAISGKLVVLMGGECGVTSRLGEGSEFWFTIRVPSDVATATTPAPSPELDLTEPGEDETAAPAPLAPRHFNAGRLLLAEDNLINRKVAVAMLSSAGYEVDTALNGAEAVRAAAARAYDAILMDCQMPELNGYEATAAIRAQEGPERHTPIIAMTAGARKEDRDRCLAEGMDGYLSKPVGKDALLALVARSVRTGLGAATSAPHPVGVSNGEITIDPAVFDELRALAASTEQDFLGTLVEQFVLDMEPRIAELHEALEAGDAPAVSRLCHDIKGGSAQLGGRRLIRSSDRLEQKAAGGSLDNGENDLRELESDFRELRHALSLELSRTGHQPDRRLCA